MEIYQSSSDCSIIIRDGISCLSFACISHSSEGGGGQEKEYRLKPLPDPADPGIRIGTCEGVIGRFSTSMLILIQESRLIGHIPSSSWSSSGINQGSLDPVFVIDKVSVIDLCSSSSGFAGTSISRNSSKEGASAAANSAVLIVGKSICECNSSIKADKTEMRTSSAAEPAATATPGSGDDRMPAQIQSIVTEKEEGDEEQISRLHAGHDDDDDDRDVVTTTPCTATTTASSSHEPKINPLLRRRPAAPHQFVSCSSSTTTTAGSLSSPTSSIRHNDIAAGGSGTSGGSDRRSRSRRTRIVQQLIKMFDNSTSFYYCKSGHGLTNTMQRTTCRDKGKTFNRDWMRAEDRFFWNKSMLLDLIECEDRDAADHWILPIMHGFFQFESLPGLSESSLILISRRSRHMAGTRYKKRGIDSSGECANYVETEQILMHNDNIISFVQVRGSIPVFWKQIGHSYRPPPIIDRRKSETQAALNLHFDRQLDLYSKTIIVNLVDNSGRESVLAHAYKNHILKYDSPDVTYVSFDFHKNKDKLCLLTDSLSGVFRDMGFLWVSRSHKEQDDEYIVRRHQASVFRVNCVDCLDRTNVVQTAFAQVMLQRAMESMEMSPIIPGEGEHGPGELVHEHVNEVIEVHSLPSSWRQVVNMMWANNGDILSHQYAGTAALKSDFTRFGERKFTGIVKDGVNSATRYYKNRFRDRTRQTVIDLMLNERRRDVSVSSKTSRADSQKSTTQSSSLRQQIRQFFSSSCNIGRICNLGNSSRRVFPDDRLHEHDEEGDHMRKKSTSSRRKSSFFSRRQSDLRRSRTKLLVIGDQFLKNKKSNS